MTTYYKAVRPNGRDFYSDTVQWAPEKTKARKGRIVKHPTSTEAVDGDFTTFLSVSTDPTCLPGSSWPLRLLEVEAAGDVVSPSERKRGGVAFKVLGEVDPSARFGPMGEHVVALIDRASRLTVAEARELGAAWCAARYAAGGAAWDAAWCAARYAAGRAVRDAAWDAVRDAARCAARYAVRDAAWGLVVRDLIGQHGFMQEHYDALTGPWRKTIGPTHPDDADLKGE